MITIGSPINNTKQKQANHESGRPTARFTLFFLATFVIYASWHILIGRKLGGYLPSIPGRIPKNDPVRSLYDAFQGSFMLGFLAVFLVAMFVNGVVLLIKINFPRIPIKRWWIILISGLTGFFADIFVIFYLEMDHGPWSNVFWPDIMSEWRAVSITTGIVALAGAFSAGVISYAFFKSGENAMVWQRSFIFSTAWWAAIIAIAWLFISSRDISEFLHGNDAPWWTALSTILIFFFMQSIPYWLILRRFYASQRTANILLASCMPFLAVFGFGTWLITGISNAIWVIQ
ncbi:MAG: hypothetical protein HZB44_05220 [Actinobacteria bacterium]|nr:hypothetical protein [Actinomycetota bacterium]